MTHEQIENNLLIYSNKSVDNNIYLNQFLLIS